MVGEIHISLFIQEVIDEVVGMDGDIDAVDTSRRMRKVIQLGGCERYRRESFLFRKGAFWFHWRGRLGG